jgi:metal-responsive CopG/Arc/MetJ family transcriptional regulator
MAIRKRNVPFMVYLTNEEMTILDKLVNDNGVEKRSHFFRALIRQAQEIYNADAEHLIKLIDFGSSKGTLDK